MWEGIFSKIIVLWSFSSESYFLISFADSGFKGYGFILNLNAVLGDSGLIVSECECVGDLGGVS